MSLLATVMMMKLLRMEKRKQLKYIKANLNNKEFMELIYLGYHTGVTFSIKLDEEKPRPQMPKDNHKIFFKYAMDAARNPFDLDKKEELKNVIKDMDNLSRYIYAKVINKTLGLSRNSLEKHIPGLIEKEPYEIISQYGSPKLPCIIQTYNRGAEAIVSIGNTSIVRDIILLKDKSGSPVSGFGKHLEAMSNLGLRGTFNIVINGANESIFIDHILGNIEEVALDIPIVITDYQIETKLSERLLVVEAALIDNPSNLIMLAPSVIIKDINDIHKIDTYDTVIARQDSLPILREAGNHSIDVSHLI